MNSDLISRQDAIEALEIIADKMSEAGQTVMRDAIGIIQELRSAEQKEHQRERFAQSR